MSRGVTVSREREARRRRNQGNRRICIRGDVVKKKKRRFQGAMEIARVNRPETRKCESAQRKESNNMRGWSGTMGKMTRESY
jgi:hypothetical protein